MNDKRRKWLWGCFSLFVIVMVGLFVYWSHAKCHNVIELLSKMTVTRTTANELANGTKEITVSFLNVVGSEIEYIRSLGITNNVQALRTIRTKTNFSSEYYAENALLAIGPKAIPCLIKVLKGKKTPWERIYKKIWFKLPLGVRRRLPPADLMDNRAKAAYMLGLFGDKASSSVKELTNCLADKSLEVRLHSTQSLGKIGPKAATAIPGIRELLTSKHSIERSVAAKAIKRLSLFSVQKNTN